MDKSNDIVRRMPRTTKAEAEVLVRALKEYEGTAARSQERRDVLDDTMRRLNRLQPDQKVGFKVDFLLFFPSFFFLFSGWEHMWPTGEVEVK